MLAGPDVGETTVFQLVPTLLYQDEKEQQGERWRFVMLNQRSEEDQDIFDDFCSENLDVLLYAGLPFNEVVFWTGPGGRINDLHLTGFRADLTRIIARAEPESFDSQQESMEL